MKGFTYNSIHSDNLIVRKIAPSLLPPITPRSIVVPGRPGVYVAGYDYGPREVNLDVAVLRQSRAQLLDALKVIASWLQPQAPAALSFDDDPSRYYLATLTNTTPIELFKSLGEGRLTFFCADPFLYGAEVSAQVGNIFVDCSYKTYPRIVTEFAESAENFVVSDPSGKYVRVLYDFEAEDVLEIDCARALVTINGERAMQYVDLASDFFAIQPGYQEITSTAPAQIYWQPRWL